MRVVANFLLRRVSVPGITKKSIVQVPEKNADAAMMFATSKIQRRVSL